MKQFTRQLLLSIFALLVTGYAVAGSEAEKNIRDALQTILPGTPVKDIRPTQIDGLSEVLVGSHVLYMSNDGKYLLQGSMIDMESRVDLSEERRKEIRTAAIGELGENKICLLYTSDAADDLYTV